jgi:hypothetical protein
MILTLPGWGRARPSADRIAFALGGRARTETRRSRAIQPRPAIVSRLFFAVRSLGAGEGGHVLQYAFADEDGRIVLDRTACCPSPVSMLMPDPTFDRRAEPVESEDLEDAMAPLCRGAELVAFHRVLQGGLLPAGAQAAAARIDCAWRRFQAVARRRGLKLDRREPLDLDACLAGAGLAAPYDDAADRALAVRRLWRWMDGAG